MSVSAKRLRLRMFSNGVSGAEIARRLGCSRSWVRQLTTGDYSGPAAQDWLGRIRQVLDEVLDERKG